LQRWKHSFGTHDGLPGEFYRECLYNRLTFGSPVGIQTWHGNIVTGKVVMQGSCGWVCADDRSGGASPFIATKGNVVWTPGVYFKGATMRFKEKRDDPVDRADGAGRRV